MRFAIKKVPSRCKYDILLREKFNDLSMTCDAHVSPASLYSNWWHLSPLVILPYCFDFTLWKHLCLRYTWIHLIHIMQIHYYQRDEITAFGTVVIKTIHEAHTVVWKSFLKPEVFAFFPGTILLSASVRV